MMASQGVVLERRGRARLPVGLQVRFAGRAGDGRRLSGTVEDLSEGGWTFVTDAELEGGEAVCLRVGLLLELRGEVRNSRYLCRRRQRRYGLRLHRFGLLPLIGGPVVEGPARPAKFVRGARAGRTPDPAPSEAPVVMGGTR